MQKIRKISLSLDSTLVTNLDYLSTRLGVSRSALVSELLADGVSEMRRLIELVPPNPTPQDLIRMRGASVDSVRERLGSLRSMSDDLFSED